MLTDLSEDNITGACHENARQFRNLRASRLQEVTTKTCLKLDKKPKTFKGGQLVSLGWDWRQWCPCCDIEIVTIVVREFYLVKQN